MHDYQEGDYITCSTSRHQCIVRYGGWLETCGENWPSASIRIFYY